MAVTQVDEILDGMSGSIEVGKRSYRRVFQVETDSPYTGPQTVIGAVSATYGILIGTVYVNGDLSETDPYALALKMSATPFGDDGREWRVTVEYGKPDSPDLTENPLEDPPTLDIEGREIEIPVERDKDGNLIVNSAGDPFDPPLTITEDHIIITIARNEATEQYAIDNPSYSGTVFSYELITANVGKVNTETFLGFGARRVKMLRPRITREFNENIGYYWKVVYRFEVIDREYTIPDPANAAATISLGVGWDRVVLDAGYRYLDATVPKLVIQDGQPVREPALLDGAGALLATADPPEYRVFKVHPETDLNTIVTV